MDDIRQVISSNCARYLEKVCIQDEMIQISLSITSTEYPMHCMLHVQDICRKIPKLRPKVN
jgi:hypothetical protein